MLALLVAGCGGGRHPQARLTVPRPPVTLSAKPILFVGGGGPEGSLLWALSRRPGLVWQIALPGGGIVSLRLCERSRVLVGLRLRTKAAALSEELLAWRAEDGRLLWRHALRSFPGAVACAPDGGRLYAATSSPPALLALTAETGKLIWRIGLEAASVSQLTTPPRNASTSLGEALSTRSTSATGGRSRASSFRKGVRAGSPYRRTGTRLWSASRAHPRRFSWSTPGAASCAPVVSLGPATATSSGGRRRA